MNAHDVTPNDTAGIAISLPEVYHNFYGASAILYPHMTHRAPFLFSLSLNKHQHNSCNYPSCEHALSVDEKFSSFAYKPHGILYNIFDLVI
jgi:hypothetical protein